MGCTIGSVIPTVTTSMPSAVGVDIGCGVMAGAVEATHTMAAFPDESRPALTAGELPDDLDGLVTNTYTLDGVNDGYVDMRSGKNIRGVMVYD